MKFFPRFAFPATSLAPLAMFFAAGCAVLGCATTVDDVGSAPTDSGTDSSAKDSGTVKDSGSTDTGKDTGKVDSGKVDTGAIDTGTVEEDTGDIPDFGSPTDDTGIDPGGDAFPGLDGGFPEIGGGTCSADTDCTGLFNCCDKAKGMCGIKLGGLLCVSL